ncbi:MAG: hypothetical protein IKE55_09430 [Kiritimatiellae bacterium]|nr:hypothetical protein [Kiritimatiellia bacterium]
MISDAIQIFDYADSLPGYISANIGAVDPHANPSAVQKERYGGVRDAEPGKAFRIAIDATPNSGNYLWVAIGFYDADMRQLSRPARTSATDATHLEMEAAAPAGAVYCRPSARFYDDGELLFETEADPDESAWGGGRYEW